MARLKNRKRSRERSRSIDLVKPVREDLTDWRARSQAGRDDPVFPHGLRDGLWTSEEYRTWRRRIYVPSAENVALPTKRPYDLRHTWASLLIAEKRQVRRVIILVNRRFWLNPSRGLLRG